MPTTIIINTNSSLDSFYESIKAMLNERYHSGGNCFAHYHMSDAEIAEQESLSSYAAHASDGIQLAPDGLHTVDGTHVERLLV